MLTICFQNTIVALSCKKLLTGPKLKQLVGETMNKFPKIIIYIIGIAIFIGSFIGMIFYGYKTFYFETEADSFAEYDYHFVLIGEGMDNEYWRLIEQGAKKSANKNNVFLEYVAPKNVDRDQMLKLLDQMISVKVDGIIIQGIEGSQFIDLIHKGVGRGIPIVTVDADVKASERKAYVGLDNFIAGQLVGQAIIQNTTGEQHVGIVVGKVTSINQQERIAGFKDAVQGIDRIQIVAIKESNMTQTGAAQATYSLLKDYPSINALVGMSALDGIGMYEGLREIAPFKEVYISAFGLLPETLYLIENDQINATIAEYPSDIGSEAVDLLIDLQEKDILGNQFFQETKIVQKFHLQHEKFINGEPK